MQSLAGKFSASKRPVSPPFSAASAVAARPKIAPKNRARGTLWGWRHACRGYEFGDRSRHVNHGSPRSGAIFRPGTRTSPC